MSKFVISIFQDEGSFQMKKAARELLQTIGSVKAADLSWRDMWAMITIKDKPTQLVGESYSKSPDVASWGAPVLLKAEIPFRSLSGK